MRTYESDGINHGYNQYVHDDDMSFEGDETDMFGHKKLGGIGDKVAAELKERSAQFNDGQKVNIINQRLNFRRMNILNRGCFFS